MPTDMFPQSTPALASRRKEAIWVAAEMRAGGAYAHSTIALDTIDEVKGKHGG